MKKVTSDKVTVQFLTALLIVLICLLSDNLFAQTKVIKDASGNYIAVKQTKKSDPDKTTGNTFTTSSGEILPIYVSDNGKYYVVRTSKNTGNQYKQYLKID
jgi:hypothetical protein